MYQFDKAKQYGDDWKRERLERSIKNSMINRNYKQTQEQPAYGYNQDDGHRDTAKFPEDITGGGHQSDDYTYFEERTEDYSYEPKEIRVVR